MNGVLINREYQVNGNWYAPSKKLEAFPSVKKAELTDTTNSAGDWTGYFIQKVLRTYYVILFSQENNYPGGRGFTLRTDEEPIALFDHEPTKEEVYKILFPTNN